MRPIDKAISIFKTKAALARALNVVPMAVRQWQVRGKIPPKQAIAIERVTSGSVTRSELCPEIFGDDAA